MSASLAAEGAAIEDRGPAVFAVTTTTLVLATVFVVARLFCRRFIVKNISWDDRIIFLAWLISFGLSFTINFGTHKGLGRHDVDIPEEDWGALRRCQYVFSILYVCFLPPPSLPFHPTKRRVLIQTRCRRIPP